MADQAIIETEELTKIYNTQTAVDRLSFSVAEGEVFGFLGPNGAGPAPPGCWASIPPGNPGTSRG
jgi:ABC-type lipopolysaccharide export system ATPase subunit